MGIEPTSSAWEAEVMPLYDTRVMRNFRNRGCPSLMPRKSIHICAVGQNFLSSYLQFTGDMMASRDNIPAQTVISTCYYSAVIPPFTENSYSMHTEVAEILIDIEAQLRQLGLWDKIPPSTQALASDQPFCVDTLTLPQWLQFIFLPTLYDMLERQQLPGRCGIAPMAEEFFKGSGLATTDLVEALLRVDELLSQDL